MNTVMKRKTILKNTYDEYYDEDENSSEEYYGEDENSFKEG